MARKDSEEALKKLDETARQVRRHIIKMVYEAGSGHPGGSLSATDVLVTLYFHTMKHRPEDPQWPERDRFVLSKGHAAPALYGCLAESGYIPVDELKTLRKIGSRLQGHPDMTKTPGVESSTGSEGQGLSNGIGMAIAGKLDRKKYQVYVMIGDGECDCGQIWEAAMSAAYFNLDNLTCIVDRNKLQLDGHTKDIMCIEPLADKWKAFGWNVIKVNGHDIRKLISMLEKARKHKGEPTVIIADTVKGKGVSFMEGAVDFHGKAPDKAQYKQAMKELGGKP
ncbi:MAG: transketolase [Candidatus Proteinoplasmatales archaeon SG8-5]|nr:MAG: transketolase [Candidatus Proteinoplasmatales archaeon SG8-5]